MLDQLDDLLMRVEEWQERCRRTLARRGAAHKLDKCLELLVLSVAGVLEGLRQTQVSPGQGPLRAD